MLPFQITSRTIFVRPSCPTPAITTLLLVAFYTYVVVYTSTGYRCPSCLWSAVVFVLQRFDIFGWILRRFRRLQIFLSQQGIWSRGKGSAVPFCVSLLILPTQAEYVAYSRTPLPPPHFPRRRVLIPIICRQPPSGQSRVYWVTQLRTDGVQCRESASSVVLKLLLVLVTGAAFSGIPWTNFCAPLFSHTPCTILCYTIL